MKINKPLEPSDQYTIDEHGRICPVYGGRMAKIPWKNEVTFDKAIKKISLSPALINNIFPPDDWTEIDPLEWDDLNTLQYLDIVEGIFLVTGITLSFGVFRFEWCEDVFFNMRPDFGFLCLVTDLNEPPINDVEAVVLKELASYNYVTFEAIKRAIDTGEIAPSELYSIDWWCSFWEKRRIQVAKPNINKSTQQETAEQRRTRITMRVDEERNKGTKNFLQIVATEEKLSTTRIKQIINKKPKPTNSWAALAGSASHTSSNKNKTK